MTAPQQNTAAFFDLDGTLLPAPSLEWRFIGYLLERDEISSAQVAAWLAHFAKTILRNPHDAIEGNKYYLAGINTSLVNDWERTLPPTSANEDSLPLFALGLKQIAWHHTQGHQIFLITGTLAPLAQILAKRIAAQTQAPIEIQVTQLEVNRQGWHSHSWLCSSEKWTGRQASQHMSNKAKAEALKAVAASHNINLAQSYAYGNAASDIPMLETVAHPQAVNPSNRLAQIAKKCRWPILNWQACTPARIPNPARTQFAAKPSQCLPMTHPSLTIWSAASSRRFAQQMFRTNAIRETPAQAPRSSTHSKKGAQI
ncbi:MAG: haloacid dehalogenase-like hydrolase [Candidatus Acidiferrales bacterium]